MNQQRIKYLDDLRVIGIFAIILVHVASLWVTSTIVGVDWQKLASTIGNIGVPIFLMISGALLLNKNYPKEISQNHHSIYILDYYLWNLLTAHHRNQ